MEKIKGFELQHVTFGYHNEHTELCNINLKIPVGSFYGIIGANGSGKTTLLLLLNGLIPHEVPGHLKGTVTVDDIDTKIKPVSYFSRYVGMLFQNPDYMLFNLTVAEEIEFGLKNMKIENRGERIKKALAMVGMVGYEKHDPQSLSLGQKQKLALACVLAMETPYIVLDEPAAMLDYQSTRDLYRLLSVINKTGKTIVVVEHDTDYLLEFADRVVILDKGRLMIDGPAKTVLSRKSDLNKFGIKIPRPLA